MAGRGPFVLVGVLALVYVAAGWAGLLVASKPGNVNALWPPSGIAVAAFRRFGGRLWPGVFLGSFVTNVVFFPTGAFTPASLGGAALIAAGSTASTVLACRLVTRLAGGRSALESPQRVAAFVVAVLVACTVAATVGLTSVLSLGGLPWEAAAGFWVTWWIGDVMGMLAVAPLSMAPSVKPPGGSLDWAGSLGLGVVALQLVFGRPFHEPPGTVLPLAWVVSPPVIWAALRLGGAGVAVHTLTIHSLVSWGTVTGRGPFSTVPPGTALLVTDGLLVSVAITGLLVVATRAQAARHRMELVAERALLEQKVSERTARLEETHAALATEAQARADLGERLVVAQKQEAIGRLAGGVAHDFNNLLTVISGEAELLAGDPAASPRAQDSARAIVAASQRAAELTRQLLAVARRQPAEPRHMDVAPALTEARRLLRPILPATITLDVEASGGTVLIDPTQFGQVILNLGINARDAMPDGGHLRIVQSTRALDEAEAAALGISAGTWVCLDVNDDGMGMDATTLARVFEPFFTTKESGRGTGLGLSTALGIASQAGGTIKVTSSPGRGTQFSLWLPYSAAPEEVPTAGATAPAPASSGSSSGTSLVAEDEPLLRRLVVSLLERQGHEVLVAADGEEALSIARQRGTPVDLLLTDVVMPRLGGAELARAVRALGPVRVLFMSGYHEQQDALAREHLITKPFATADFLNAVETALGRPRDP